MLSEVSGSNKPTACGWSGSVSLVCRPLSSLPLDRAILVPFPVSEGKDGDQAKAAPRVTQPPATTRTGTKRRLYLHPAPIKGASWAAECPRNSYQAAGVESL